MLTTLSTQAMTAVVHADTWRRDHGWWPVFPLLWLLFLAGVVATVVLLRRRDHRQAPARAGATRLAERYAAGEITEQEYRERLAVIQGSTR